MQASNLKTEQKETKTITTLQHEYAFARTYTHSTKKNEMWNKRVSWKNQLEKAYAMCSQCSAIFYYVDPISV